MQKLTFKYQRGFQVDPTLTKPVNEASKKINEMRVTDLLNRDIERINKQGGYILVTVGQDGEKFENRIMGLNDTLFAELTDKL